MVGLNKFFAIIIFLLVVLSTSAISGYSYVGDNIEKLINAFSMFFTYFVLAALLAIYRGVRLFKPLELKFLAGASVIMTLFSYLYPVLIYSEQNSSDFLSTFFYDLVLMILIVSLLVKESQRDS